MARTSKTARDERNRKKSKIIHATLQAKIWRNQLKEKHKNTIVKTLQEKLKKKYPELSDSEINYISVKVI